MSIASLVGFLLMVIAVVGLVFTYALFSPSPVVVAVQVAAVVLMAWARLTLGRRSFHPAADVTGGGLVTTGPYRFIRHPIYAAACGAVTDLAQLRGMGEHERPVAFQQRKINIEIVGR